jgi:hypothetical protein
VDIVVRVFPVTSTLNMAADMSCEQVWTVVVEHENVDCLWAVSVSDVIKFRLELVTTPNWLCSVVVHPACTLTTTSMLTAWLVTLWVFGPKKF